MVDSDGKVKKCKRGKKRLRGTDCHAGRYRYSPAIVLGRKEFVRNGEGRVGDEGALDMRIWVLCR